MHYLVLGGTGFIGSHLVDALIEQGHQIRILDRSLKFRDAGALPHVEYIQADYGNATVIAEALIGIDAVIHLVSSTVPSTSNLEPIADIQSNLINSVMLLQAKQAANITRIIYFSSGGTIYGNPENDFPMRESHPKHPLCSYGITKLAIENYLYLHQQLYGLKPIILRPSNPYGPRQGHMGAQGAIATFINRILNNQEIHVWGDGSIVRDFVYITDLVDACIKAINSNITGTFNIGSGQGYSILEVIRTIESYFDKEADIIFKPGRYFDIKKMVLDISAIKKIVDWSPTTSLEEGIYQHCEWYENNIHS